MSLRRFWNRAGFTADFNRRFRPARIVMVVSSPSTARNSPFWLPAKMGRVSSVDGRSFALSAPPTNRNGLRCFSNACFWGILNPIFK